MPHPITNRNTEQISRPDLLKNYLTNMGVFLSIGNTDSQLVDKAEIAAFLRKVINTKFESPTIDRIYHDKPGDARLEKVKLIDHVNQTKNKVILPSGSAYKPSTEIVSFLKDQITDQKAARKTSKKLMFKYKEEGNNTLAEYYNSDQALQKIGMNSTPGAMGSKHSFVSDIAGFNSITSTGRYCVMSAYANCERLLEANFYFPTTESIFNYLVLQARITPSKEVVNSALKGLGLKHAMVDDVVDFLQRNYNKYVNGVLPIWIYHWLCNCPGHILDYIYYNNNLKHIIQGNSEVWQAKIRKLFDISDVNIDAPVDLEILRQLDGDLIIILSTVYTDWLPVVNKKKTNIYDAIKLYPEIATRLTNIGIYMQQSLDEIKSHMDIFLNHGTVIQNVLGHKNMYRNCVIGSDTDSIIYTTKNWLQWFNGNLAITNDAIKINCLIVYWLSKSISYLLNTISLHKGALGDDIKGIKMKNEFFYPVMTLSNLMKHYAGMYLVQEGVVLPEPRSDIKGVQYKGSKLCSDTLTYTKDFIDSTHLTIIQHGQISAKDCINKVISLEATIYKSLSKGETNYLSIQPVKNEKDYADSNSSLYFNYTLWQDVFSEKYGNIEIPTKCFVIPIVGIRSQAYLDFLNEKDPDICAKLVRFLDSNKKDITRIPINPALDIIPEELVPLIATRSIIADNCGPMYLFLKSFGISVGNTKKTKFLFTDVYGGL